MQTPTTAAKPATVTVTPTAMRSNGGQAGNRVAMVRETPSISSSMKPAMISGVRMALRALMVKPPITTAMNTPALRRATACPGSLGLAWVEASSCTGPCTGPCTGS